MCIILHAFINTSLRASRLGERFRANKDRLTRSAASRTRRSLDSPGQAAGTNTDYRDVALQTNSHENGNDLALVSVRRTSPDRAGVPSHVPGGAPGDRPLPVRRSCPCESLPARCGPGSARRSPFPAGAVAPVSGTDPERPMIPTRIRLWRSPPTPHPVGRRTRLHLVIGSGCPSSPSFGVRFRLGSASPAALRF